MQRKDKLRQQIMEAFKATTYPGDSLLISISRDYDSEEVFERLQGKSWMTLLAELDSFEGPELYRVCWIYGFLTPESFYYYLPAFLVTAMDPARADTTAIHLLYMFKDIQSDKFYQKFMLYLRENLSADQKASIKEFFAYLSDEEPDFISNHQGIYQYWQQEI